DVAFEVPNVKGLAFEDENGLRVNVAAAHDRAGGGLAFGEENHRSLAFALGLAEMFLAVFELRDADGDGLGALAGEFFDFLKLFPELPGVLDFGDDFFGDVLVTVEEMEQLLANSIDEFGADVGVAELVLGLGLEDGVLEAIGNRADHAFADVVAFEFLVGALVDGFQKALAERPEL